MKKHVFWGFGVGFTPQKGGKIRGSKSGVSIVVSREILWGVVTLIVLIVRRRWVRNGVCGPAKGRGFWTWICHFFGPFLGGHDSVSREWTSYDENTVFWPRGSKGGVLDPFFPMRSFLNPPGRGGRGGIFNDFYIFTFFTFFKKSIF